MHIQTKIHSCASYLPKQKINSDDFFKSIDLEKKFEIPNKWMSKMMGIKERRVAKAHQSPSDLATLSAEAALAKASHINPDEIDALIFCGIEKDQSEPATAHNVQSKLGTSAKYIFDVTNACFGFFDGVELAEMFVATGRARYVLLVTGETQSKLHQAMIQKMETGATRDDVKRMLGFFSLGDAGGAMLIGKSEDTKTGFKFFKNKVNSSLSDKCYYKLNANKFEGQMLMSEIMDRGFEMQESTLVKNMHNAGWSKFDWLLTHQTGTKNYHQTQKLNVTEPNRVIKTFDTLGNITSATLPVTFDVLLNNDKLEPGHNIGGAFAGSGLITGQFGYTI